VGAMLLAAAPSLRRTGRIRLSEAVRAE
jgi:hypothetical protein